MSLSIPLTELLQRLGHPELLERARANKGGQGFTAGGFCATREASATNPIATSVDLALEEPSYIANPFLRVRFDAKNPNRSIVFTGAIEDGRVTKLHYRRRDFDAAQPAQAIHVDIIVALYTALQQQGNLPPAHYEDLFARAEAGLPEDPRAVLRRFREHLHMALDSLSVGVGVGVGVGAWQPS